MYKAVKEKLNELGAKYNERKFSIEEQEFILFDTTIPQKEKSECDEQFDLTIWFANAKTSPYLCFRIPRVMDIPSGHRARIKNAILDFNTRNLIGSFGISYNKKFIEFIYTVVLTYSVEGQAYEIGNLDVYLYMIRSNVDRFKSEIKNLMEYRDEEQIQDI